VASEIPESEFNPRSEGVQALLAESLQVALRV
jgi:hypothetical protein